MGRDWRWNQEDTKLIQVNDWIWDLHAALELVNEPGLMTAIQAGGAMGVWPWVMSSYFHTVHTFEPDRENYLCLFDNTHDRKNVIPHFGALSDHDGYCKVKLPPSEQSNAGAYYIEPVAEGVASPNEKAVPVFAIDTLIDSGDVAGVIGLIQLDIEGFELRALKGAERTIVRDSPVIMVEDKPLPQDKETGHVFGAVERWLIDEMGYKLHTKVHRDLIFVPGK
jgi:FkbM family methyltransferase